MEEFGPQWGETQRGAGDGGDEVEAGISVGRMGLSLQVGKAGSEFWAWIKGSLKIWAPGFYLGKNGQFCNAEERSSETLGPYLWVP